MTHKVHRQNVHLAPCRQTPKLHARTLEDRQETKASVRRDEGCHDDKDDEDAQVRPSQPTLEDGPDERAKYTRTRGKYANENQG